MMLLALGQGNVIFKKQSRYRRHLTSPFPAMQPAPTGLSPTSYPWVWNRPPWSHFSPLLAPLITLLPMPLLLVPAMQRVAVAVALSQVYQQQQQVQVQQVWQLVKGTCMLHHEASASPQEHQQWPVAVLSASQPPVPSPLQSMSTRGWQPSRSRSHSQPLLRQSSSR
jgi:hypothetical protein